jgi:hypothetical protein
MGAVIQEVLMCLSTNLNGKIKSLLKIHDLALVIEQSKRDGMSAASFDAMVVIFKSLMGELTKVKLLLIYKCNFHVLNHLLLIYICKLHWNLNTMSVCQVNSL